MGQTLLAAVTSGLALAGVLTVGGVAAARFATHMPHLGVAGVGAGVAVLAGRLTNLPWPLAMAVVAAAAGAAGIIAGLVDRRARAVDAPVWPPALLPDVAVLALGVAIATLARPAAAIELPLGPLGGLGSTTGAIAAGAVGFAGALLVAGVPGHRRRMPVWMLAVVLTAVAMALGGGSLALRGEALVPAFGIPDVVGVAVRAVAVGVIARKGTGAAVAAALVLGVGESLLRTQWSFGDAAVVPALLVVAYGLWHTYRKSAAVATA